MRQKIYNFDKKIGSLGDIKFEVSDYFQYYHTGIEELIVDDMLYITDRNNNERSEVLAYEFFESADLSDTILALNNDVYLWDTPYDNDMYETSIDLIMEYIKKKNKTRMNIDVEERYQEIARAHVSDDDSMLRSVIIPRQEYVQKISRVIKDYLKSRIVE